MSLEKLLPSIYIEADQTDGSLATFVDAFDYCQNEVAESVEVLSTVALPIPTPLPQDVATRYGNPFLFLSDARLKEANKLGYLTSAYRWRGSALGIIHVCRWLCGVRVAIVADTDYTWKLGVSRLGHSRQSLSFRDGFGYSAFGQAPFAGGGSTFSYEFNGSTILGKTDETRIQVVIPRDTPQDTQDEIAAIVDFMRPAKIQWRFVYAD